MYEDIEERMDQAGASTKTVSCEAEYNALREEKLFRYNYSNQINTTLLTTTIAIFSIGILLFNIEDADSGLIEFARFFFPMFFLLPCVFAKICFHSALRNSMRIGLLSEYIRAFLIFENYNYSWETLKQSEKVNYFYDISEKGLNGVKDMPIRITYISIVFSAAISRYPLIKYTGWGFLNFLIMLIPLSLILLCVYLLQYKIQMKADKEIKWWCYILIPLIYLLAFSLSLLLNITFKTSNVDMHLFISTLLYDLTLISVVLDMPTYQLEIDEANEKFNSYKNKINIRAKSVKNEK